MKRVMVIVGMVIGCNSGPDRNEIMTRLINEKKVTEDSINSSAYYEDDFMKKARAEHDSVKYKPFIDSSTKYYMIAHVLKSQLVKINFSIDSLSKMK